MHKLLLSIITAFFVFPIISQGQGTYTRIVDVPYVSDGNPRHMLDLYIPNGMAARTPAIVWIHGGGWQNGSKSFGQNSFHLRYPSKGYALVSINYRLSGEAIYPAQIHDVKAAIRWLRANAATYNIDPTRIGVWGSSAGGHLAALVGTSADVTGVEGSVGGNLAHSSRVQAVADWYGPTDFLRMDAQTKSQAGCGNGNHDSPTSPESLLTGCTIQTCPQAVQAANPMSYVSDDDPPFYIQHGTADCTVPTGQSQIFFELLMSRSLDAVYRPISDAGHGGPLFSEEANLLLLDQFWQDKLLNAVNPLVTRVRVFRKSVETGYLRRGSLGTFYWIQVEGENLMEGGDVLIAGQRLRLQASNGGWRIFRLRGLIPLGDSVALQLRLANGRYSNALPIEIRDF